MTDPAAPNPQTLPPVVAVGDIVADKYRVERIIDEGGMGIVVEATHLVLEERVALKFLRREILGRAAFVSRFTQEARAAVKLKSEHVARVFDVGVQADTGPFLVMEYLEGRDLRGVLEDQGCLGAAAAVEYVIQACEGLAEAHARGIIHRDLKPENLFLVERSHDWKIIKILDFGISKLRGAVTEADGGHNTLSMMGSPLYMPPEQVRSTRTVDHRADIWSLGAVLFELLCGVTPFDAHRPLPEIIAAVLEEPPRSLAELAPALPDGLEAVVLRCLEKDPANRYQNAAELALALLPFASRRARTQVERALAVTRAAGLLTDPNQSLPPSIAPAPSGNAAAIGAALDARIPSVRSVTPHPHATTVPAPPFEETAPTERAPAMPPEGATTIAPVSQEGGRRRPALWFTAGLVGVVGVAVVILLVGRDRSAPPPPVTAPATAEAQPPVAPQATATVPEPPTPASSASGAGPRSSARPKRTDPQPPVSAQRPPPAPSQGPELDIRRTR